jgi:hypothetical protein
MNAFEPYETVDQRFKALVQSNLNLQKKSRLGVSGLRVRFGSVSVFRDRTCHGLIPHY